MTEQEASLIIRMHIALCEEGIGPARRALPSGEWADDQVADDKVLKDAVAAAGHLFDHDTLKDVWLMSSEERS